MTAFEGVHPERFDGNRARTRIFLNRFNRFALMTNDATFRDELKGCAYFLSLIEGPNVKGWCERAYAQLHKIQNRVMPLPPNVTAWNLLEKDFTQSFIDYAEQERAEEELRTLSMRGDQHCDVRAFSSSRRLKPQRSLEPSGVRIGTSSHIGRTV
jgi:hypothetical protein